VVGCTVDVTVVGPVEGVVAVQEAKTIVSTNRKPSDAQTTLFFIHPPFYFVKFKIFSVYVIPNSKRLYNKKTRMTKFYNTP
jgi:hypothetical protein